MSRVILGHIDCPSCGTKSGMRITSDKNGEPFGYCEADCSQQLRIGGDKRRVAAFVARYPWAKPVTAPVPAPTPAAEKVETALADKPKTAQAAPKPIKAKAQPFDILAQFSK